MHALFRALETKRNRPARFQRSVQIFVCNSLTLSLPPRPFPDEMVATANRSANELSPLVRMMLVLYGCGRTHAISTRARNAHAEKIFSLAGRAFFCSPSVRIKGAPREKCDRVEAQLNKSITNHNYLTCNMKFVTGNNKNKWEKINYSQL